MSALAERVPPTLLVLWRKVRQLLPVYAAIADSFGFTAAPRAEVSSRDTNDEDVLHIAAWIEEIDNVSQPHHLRTVLQELDLCSSDLCVSTWLQHFISKPVRQAADRDKIDFLLSHYLRTNLPPSLQEGKPNYAAMKAVLEPVLGSCEGELPEDAREIDEMIGIAERCRSLAEFEHSGIIRRGRELKLRAGELYFTPPFLLAFTHFNAVVRRECLRLMNSDLKFIGDALDRLEQQGITHIDCTAANWSANEPVIELKNRWATWELVANDYSQDFFANLIAFRSSVEEALDRCIELSMTSVSQELRSIHALLLDMRTQIDELPRRFGDLARTHATEEPAPIAARPVLAWQSSAKQARPAPSDKPVSQALSNSAKENDLQHSTEEPAADAAPCVPQRDPIAAAPPAVKLIPAADKAAATPVSAVPVVPQKPKDSVVSGTAVITTAAVPVPATTPKASASTAVAESSPATPPESKKPSEAATAVSAQKAATESSAPQQPPAAAANVGAPIVGEAGPRSKPQPVPTVPNDGNATPAAVDLEEGIARLQKTLSGKRPTAVSIAVAGTRILLTSTEASMFSVANDRFARAVQRAVMMRICLVSALETHSKTREKSGVAALVVPARAEYSAIKELVSESKAQKLAREEEVLSATAKQLSAMLERAERIAR